MANISDNEIKQVFSNNLARILSNREMDGAELARLLGAEKQSVYAWLKMKSFPSAKNLQKIVDVLNVSSDDLLSSNPVDSDSYVDVPLLGSIAAGAPIDMDDIDDFFPIPYALQREHPRAFLLKVSGESMNRHIPDGAYALVDPDDCEPNERNAYAVCVNGYTATIKRVKKLSNGYELIPDSYDPTQRPIIFDYNDDETEEVTIIGRVVWYTIPFDFEI